MVEFVFVLPILLMLVFAIIVFGLALGVKQDVTRAAAEGARAAAVALPDTAGTGATAVSEAQEACEEAIDRMFGGADASCDEPSVQVDAFGRAYAVSVTVRYDAENAFIGNQVPFIGAVLPPELVHTAVVRVNQP